MAVSTFQLLKVKNTFIEFDLRGPSHTRAASCPPQCRDAAQPHAASASHPKVGFKDLNDEMSYASTVDSDEGCLRLRGDTDTSDDTTNQSPSGALRLNGDIDMSDDTGNQSLLASNTCPWGTWMDFGIPTSPSHPHVSGWATGEYYESPRSALGTTPVGYMRDPVTTTMLRNIPQRFDRESLLDNLISNGFFGSFDFVYMPSDFSTGVSLGYAFINFISEAVYMRFKSIYAGLKLAEESPKVCVVCDAKVQGMSQNVEFYRNSTVMIMEPKYHPVVFENGVRQRFPMPTRPLGPVIRKSGSPKHAARASVWGQKIGNNNLMSGGSRVGAGNNRQIFSPWKVKETV